MYQNIRLAEGESHVRAKKKKGGTERKMSILKWGLYKDSIYSTTELKKL